MAELSMIAASLFITSVLLKGFVLNVPPAQTASAGLVANVLLPVCSTKSIFAPGFPDRPMFAMAAHSAINVPWKSICTKPLMLTKSMNLSEVNPALVSPFQKSNSDRTIALFPHS